MEMEEIAVWRRGLRQMSVGAWEEGLCMVYGVAEGRDGSCVWVIWLSVG